MFPIHRALALAALAFLAPHAQTWQKIYPADATPRDAVLMGWDNQSRIFVWDAAASARGVYYSTNGGSTWLHENLDAGLALTTFLSFAVAPNGTLYALANVAAPSSAGVYRSTDLGKTWTLVHPKPDLNINSPAPAVRPSGDLYFYGRPSPSTSVTGWLYHSTNTGTAWDSLPSATIQVCKRMDVDPAGKLYMVCNSSDNVNFRPWVSANGTAFTAFRTTSGGVGGGCEYSLSTDVTGAILVGCSNGTVGMALNGTDTLLLSQIGNGAGGEVTGVAARSATEFLASANNSGVFRSINAGGVWARAGQGMTGNDSALVRSLRRGPDGRAYAATSGFMYAYGTATAIGDNREYFPTDSRIRKAGGGWIVAGKPGDSHGIIRIRNLEGRLLYQATASPAGTTFLSSRGLPRGVLILELQDGARRTHFRLPPL